MRHPSEWLSPALLAVLIGLVGGIVLMMAVHMLGEGPLAGRFLARF